MNNSLNIIIRLFCFSVLLLLSQTIFAQTAGYGTLRDYAPLRYSAAYGGLNTDASFSLLHKSVNYGQGVNRNRSIITGALPWIDKETKALKGGGGLYYLNEKPTESLGFETQEIGGSFAYTVRLRKNHDLSMGLGVSWTSIRLNTEGVTTGSLWHPIYGLVDGAEINENLSTERNSYTSIYGSLLWSSLDLYDREKHRFGVNVYRLNQPKNSSDLSNDHLDLGWSAMANFHIWVNPYFTITPDLMYDYMDQRHTIQSTIWAGYHFFNENPTDPISTGGLEAGLSYSNHGQMGLGFKFDQKHYEIAFFNYFQTKATSAFPEQSTFEVAFRLKKGLAKRKRNRSVYYKSTATNPRDQYRSFNSNRGGGRDENLDTSPASTDEVIDEPRREMKPIKYILQYRLNETTLTRHSQMQLDYTVKLLKSNDHINIRIVGHSDDLGAPKVKAKVAWERAKQIRDYLRKEGIEPHRIQASSKADNEPMVDNDTDEHRAENRRVELFIYEK
ncbi:OmpA family protein [Flammeovirga aprica]|uniref:OmpA family protein n=1 Tax=Flammeovirga aprica JL-4 TaxID=694437 RepID=A0A7X9X9W6_9BACT|nr:OmpA family protein [Flammeovirga aprica]NME69089.1 OmpA family protein [Flammeovirga aprica JL-4]